MKKKLFYLLSIIAVAVFVGGCWVGPPHYFEDLDNGYVVVATDIVQDARIIRKDPNRPSSGGVQVVPPTVFAYSWNEDFILAKRHPRKSYRKVDASVTYWYIIEVTSGDVHGPLNEDEFRKLRTKLKVPEEISFKTIQ